MATLLWSTLGYLIYPVWLLVGVVDYASHQRTHIAVTSGLGEAMFHIAQTALIGVAVLLVLFVEINALSLSIIAACVLTHTVMAYWDIAYSDKRRCISPLEQFAHAFQITLPIFALALLVFLYWLVPHERLPRFELPTNGWNLTPRGDPFDLRVTLAVIGTSAVLGVAPALVEFVQSWRAGKVGEVRAPGNG
jgi:hypothetical protein